MTTDCKLDPESLVLKNFHYEDDRTRSVVSPIYPSATFARNENYELERGYNYRRYGAPNITHIEKLLASLEQGRDALVFSSGLAAIAALTETLRAGARIVAPQIMYHGAQDWFRRLAETRGIGLSLFDETDPNTLHQCVASKATDLVWLETPCNPTWDVIDIGVAASIAHNAGAILAVDGTMAPPCTTQALNLGADIVFHSTTKYLNGHHDITGGVLVSNTLDARWEEIYVLRKLMGNIMSPFDAWLLMRGVRTLFLRFSRSSESAMVIAKHFDKHPLVERVLYPGLKQHPGHAIAKKQMSNGFGGMLSLLVKGGADEARCIATATQVFTPATSLGGVESLIEHRKSVEGPHSSVRDNLLRLSIGIEHPVDLIADLEQAIERID